MESFSKLNKDDLIDMIESIHTSSLTVSKLVENYLLLTNLETISKPKLKELIVSDRSFIVTNSKSLKDILKVYEDDNYRNNEFEKQIENINLKISPIHFDKCISEIMQNAVKHSPRMSLIKIRAWMVDDIMNFECTNRYRGNIIKQMSDIENCLLIEDSNSKSKLGLGLSIVRKITDLYGGSLKFEVNKKLKNVTVTLSIPS